MNVRYLVGPLAQVCADGRQIKLDVCGEGLPYLQRPYPLRQTISDTTHVIAVIAAVGDGVSQIISSAVGAWSLSGPPYGSFGTLLYRLPMLE